MPMRRLCRRHYPYALAAVLAAFITTFAVTATSTAAPSSPVAANAVPTQLKIRTSRALRRAPGEIISRALAHLGPGAAVDVVTAVDGPGAVETVEPRAGRPEEGFPDIGPVWVVRARGYFVGRHVPPGKSPVLANSGYLLISDETGNIFGMGMP